MKGVALQVYYSRRLLANTIVPLPVPSYLEEPLLVLLMLKCTRGIGTSSVYKV